MENNVTWRVAILDFSGRELRLEELKFYQRTWRNIRVWEALGSEGHYHELISHSMFNSVSGVL